MRRELCLAAGCVGIVVRVGCLGAQASRGPAFAVEPGVIIENAVSPAQATGSSTGLNLRFVMTFPARIPWLTGELGISFAPVGLSNGQRDRNEPTFFYGPSIMLLPRDRTRNWLELSLPVLGSYHLDVTGDAERLYVNDIVVQTSAVVPVGEKLMADMGRFWSSLTLYGIIEQNLTPPRNSVTRTIDRFSPTFLYGISIRVLERSHHER